MSAYTQPEPPISSVEEPRWDGLRWRIGLAVITFALGLYGFLSGVGVTERSGIADSGILAYCYYTLGLFIFGGMDLGTPIGGPLVGRVALWVAYFAAPILTASALVEGLVRLLGVEHFGRARLTGHYVVVGCDRLTHLYLRKLRDVAPKAPVLVLGAPGESAKLYELRERFRVHILEGRATSRVILKRLRLQHACRILVLTNDDFTNFDTATRVLEVYPAVGDRMVVHVRDLLFLRSVHRLNLPVLKTVFNGHAVAAQHLVRARLIAHFKSTVEQDNVVLAGFGHFGQTVLNELQQHAVGHFGRVVILDRQGRLTADTFHEQVGFLPDYRYDVFTDDIRSPDAWQRIDELIDLDEGSPVIIIGSGDDQANIRVALMLSLRFPNLYLFARNETQWSFADSLSTASDVEIVNVIQLVADSMPDSWFSATGPVSRPGSAVE